MTSIEQIQMLLQLCNTRAGRPTTKLNGGEAVRVERKVRTLAGCSNDWMNFLESEWATAETGPNHFSAILARVDRALWGRVLIWAILRGQYARAPHPRMMVEVALFSALVAAPLVWLECLFLTRVQ